MKRASYDHLRFLTIFYLILQVSCSCEVAGSREMEKIKGQATQVEGYTKNMDRVITIEELKSRPFKEIPESLKLAFMSQKIPMIGGDTISPLVLAGLMEESFPRGAMRVCFIEADKIDINDLTRQYDLSEYRKEWDGYFPDKNGLFHPLGLMKYMLPWYSFFWRGDTLMISRVVGGG